MVAPNFKKALDTTPGNANKYGAQDIVKIVDVLQGTHANERIQIESIEQVTNPWTYYVYVDSIGTTQARRGDTSRAEFTSSTNPCIVINSAISTAYSEYGKAVIFLAPQTFNFPNPGVGVSPSSSGPNTGKIDLDNVSNLSIIGAGMDKTIINIGCIRNDSSSWRSNILISDITVNAGGIDGDTASGFGNSFRTSRIHDSRLIRCRGLMSRGFNLDWATCDRMYAFQCHFSESGVAGPGFGGTDTAAGGQTRTQEDGTTPNDNETVFDTCVFYKQISKGGGQLTTGGTGNLLINKCSFVNDDTNSYQGISIEDTYGPSLQVRVIGCRGYGPRMGCQIGAAGGTYGNQKAIISQSHFAGPVRVYRSREAIISDTVVENSQSMGFNIIDCTNAQLHHCIVRNTNVIASVGDNDLGGVSARDVKYLTIDHVSVIDTKDVRTARNGSAFTASENTPWNTPSGTQTTPIGIYVSQTTTGTNEVIISDCILTGDPTNPGSPWITTGTGGNALQILKCAKAIVRGGIMKGPAPTFTSNTFLDVRGLNGYNPVGPASINVGNSPFTYTNTDGVPETVYINGGTVSNVTLDGTSLFTATNRSVWLEPGQEIIVTYSVIPTMVKDRK